MKNIVVLVRDALYREALASLLLGHGLEVVPSEDKAEAAVADGAGTTPGELEALAGRLPVVLLAETGEHINAPVERRVSRSEGSMSLVETIRGLGGGMVRESRSTYGGLTPREREVAGLVARGMSNRTIAGTLGMQEQSVKNLVSAIMRKMRCENRTQVALQLRVGSASGEA